MSSPLGVEPELRHVNFFFLDGARAAEGGSVDADIEVGIGGRAESTGEREIIPGGASGTIQALDAHFAGVTVGVVKSVLGLEHKSTSKMFRWIELRAGLTDVESGCR